MFSYKLQWIMIMRAFENELCVHWLKKPCSLMKYSHLFYCVKISLRTTVMELFYIKKKKMHGDAKHWDSSRTGRAHSAPMEDSRNYIQYLFWTRPEWLWAFGKGSGTEAAEGEESRATALLPRRTLPRSGSLSSGAAAPLAPLPGASPRVLAPSL